MKKKVFSKEKWFNDILHINPELKEYIYLKMNDKKSWVNECDGLTKEEMNELGRTTHDDWMVEVEEDE